MSKSPAGVGEARSRSELLIGVISDTHGLLRPEAVAALQRSDYIIHAGDVGKEEILRQLTAIAPLTAIRGNIDRDPWARKLPETEVIEIAGITTYVLHNLAQLDLKPEAAGFHVVISGHTHAPKQETKNGVLYLNPGSAGPRRFKLPVSVARLKIGAGETAAEIVVLKT
jgi:putative phosphoesterase